MTIVFIFLIIALLFLEAATDGYIYLAWTGKKKGWIHHSTQEVMLIGYAVLGGVFVVHVGVGDAWLLLKSAALLYAGRIMIRYGIFDIFYNSVTNNTTQGSTALFDRLAAKFPILNNVLLRMVVLFGGAVVISFV